MQTFLPIASFFESATCLDFKRLGKQRVEAWQILQTLYGKSNGWINHPAVRMWKGYEHYLSFYGLAICAEWKRRGYKDNLLMEKFWLEFNFTDSDLLPPWLGDEAFHSSHRAALLAKDLDWYSQFGWTEEPKIDYIWPI